MPLGLWLGHIGRAEFLAVGIANVGRAVPAAGDHRVLRRVPRHRLHERRVRADAARDPADPHEHYVGVRQVDRELVDAARGQGLSELQIVRQIEAPLALPTIFGGVRISVVTVLATAIIAPARGLRHARHADPRRSASTAPPAQLGAAIVVAVLTLAADAVFAARAAARDAEGPEDRRAATARPPLDRSTR